MAEEAAEQPKSNGKMMGIVFMVVNLLVTGGGAFLVFASTIGYTAPTISDEALNQELEEFRKSLQTEPVVYNMETLTTNLDGLPRRMIRLEVNVEMLDEEGFEEVMSLGGQSRDAIVRIMNGKKYQDLSTVQGKLHLKNEIISMLNSSMKRGVAKNVYFSKFVIQ